MMERWGGFEEALITDVSRRVDPDMKFSSWPGAAPLDKLKEADKGRRGQRRRQRDAALG